MPNPSGEPGPDFSTFQGGAGAAGGIIGTNQLQSAIDKFTQAVDKLDAAVAKISSIGGGSGAAGSFGLAGGLPSMGAAAGPSTPFPRPSNPFANPATPGGASQPVPGAAPASSGPAWFPSMLSAPFTGTAAGGAGSAAAGAAAGGGPPPTMGGANGGGSSGISVPGGVGGVAGGVLGAGGPGAFMAKTAMANIPAPLAAGIAGLAGAGSAQMPSQLALNTLQYTSALGGQNYQTTRMGAMGTMGGVNGGQLQNQFSLNPQDAAAGYATLQQATASVNPYGTQYGAQNVMGAMGAMNIANPAMSAQQNAQAVGNLYNPSTSMRMMMAGYPVTPDVAGTGAHRSMAAVMAPLLERIGGGRKMSQSQLFTQLQPNERGNISLQNLTGGNAAEMSQYSQGLMLQNALMTGANGQKQMSIGQVNQTFSELASQNTSTFNKAQATLKQYGLNQSDYQALKSKAGGAAANVSDTSQGFTTGLQTATRSLSDFNTALHKIINSVPGGKGIMGAAEGFMANIMPNGAAAPPTSSKSPPPSTSAGASNRDSVSSLSGMNAKASKAVMMAKGQLGTPYVYGKETPMVGFDCSALPQWAYRQAGIYLPRSASSQYDYLKKDTVSPLKTMEGDLVFTDSTGGNTMHEAMVIDNGRNIIESPSAGGYVRTRPYSAGEWRYAARPTAGKGSSLVSSSSKNRPNGAPGKANVTSGGVTGAEVASYARSFGTGRNHPYVWGGSTPSGWDCSGFSAYVYEHFKLFPGHEGSRYGTSESQYSSSLLKASGDTPGALVFFNTHDGQAPPSHVGVSLGGGKYVGADDPNVGTVVDSSGGNMGFRVPKKGFTGGSAVSGGSSSSSTSTGSTGPPGAMGSGMGDSTTEGSTSEMSAYTGAIMGAAGGPIVGSDYTAAKSSSSGGGSTTSGPASPGLLTVGRFLMSAGYSRAAAAGAAGVVGGESSGNPESGIQSGNGGLIGWTPSSAAFPIQPIITGNARRDMGAQLTDMLAWMKKDGWGPPQSHFPNTLAGAMAAADSASATYEKPLVRGSDVHQQFVAEVFNKLAIGGSVRGGSMAWVGERGPELVSFTNDSTVHNASQSARLMKSTMAKSPQGPWSAGSGTSLVTSGINPAFSGNTGNSTNGMTFNVVMNVGTGSGGAAGPTTSAGMSTVGRTSGERMAKAFAKQLKIEMAKINLSTAIGTGVSS